MYDLEQARLTLMAKLPTMFKETENDNRAMFLDATNAWFCGSGPTVAEKGLGKDGVIRRQIGIVLLCNKNGFPLRWEVVGGSSTDKTTMLNTLNDIKDLNWVK